MKYLLISLLLINFVGCRKINCEMPKLQKGGDSEAPNEDKTLPSDFKERMRQICPL